MWRANSFAKDFPRLEKLPLTTVSKHISYHVTPTTQRRSDTRQVEVGPPLATNALYKRETIQVKQVSCAGLSSGNEQSPARPRVRLYFGTLLTTIAMMTTRSMTQQTIMHIFFCNRKKGQVTLRDAIRAMAHVCSYGGASSSKVGRALQNTRAVNVCSNSFTTRKAVWKFDQVKRLKSFINLFEWVMHAR